MQIDERNAAGMSVYHGKAYHFCSTGCKATFDRDPQKYAGAHGEDQHQH